MSVDGGNVNATVSSLHVPHAKPGHWIAFTRPRLRPESKFTLASDIPSPTKGLGENRTQNT
jgi:hypothetical protein